MAGFESEYCAGVMMPSLLGNYPKVPRRDRQGKYIKIWMAMSMTLFVMASISLMTRQSPTMPDLTNNR